MVFRADDLRRKIIFHPWFFVAMCRCWDRVQMKYISWLECEDSSTNSKPFTDLRGGQVHALSFLASRTIFILHVWALGWDLIVYLLVIFSLVVWWFYSSIGSQRSSSLHVNFIAMKKKSQACPNNYVTHCSLGTWMWRGIGKPKRYRYKLLMPISCLERSVGLLYLLCWFRYLLLFPTILLPYSPHFHPSMHNKVT